MRKTLGPLFAVRKVRHQETQGALEIQLGKPHRAQKDWVCTFQIAGLSRGTVQQAYGVDPLQALLCAIAAIRAALVETGHRFEWLGGEARDGGIPRHIPEILGEAFAQKVDRLIEESLARRLRSAKRKAARLGKRPLRA